MPLRVIGAGLGRTGTLSLKLALEQLGLGPCYHMLEVRTAPERLEHWNRIAAGEKVAPFPSVNTTDEFRRMIGIDAG
jgi:hypothetical protein